MFGWKIDVGFFLGIWMWVWQFFFYHGWVIYRFSRKLLKIFKSKSGLSCRHLAKKPIWSTIVQLNFMSKVITQNYHPPNFPAFSNFPGFSKCIQIRLNTLFTTTYIYEIKLLFHPNNFIKLFCMKLYNSSCQWEGPKYSWGNWILWFPYSVCSLRNVAMKIMREEDNSIFLISSRIRLDSNKFNFNKIFIFQEGQNSFQ